MKAIFKVFFQLLTWEGGSCYVYTTTPSYKASASQAGSQSGASFSVSITKAGQDTSSNSDRVTMWLSDSDRHSLPEEEAELYRDVYGDECYLVMDTSNNFTLMKPTDFQNLDTSEQTYLTATLPA